MRKNNIKVEKVKIRALSQCELPRRVEKVTACWDRKNKVKNGELQYVLDNNEIVKPNRCIIISFSNWNGFEKGVGVLWAEESHD